MCVGGAAEEPATHLGLGHVQQAHGVAVAVEEGSDGVESLVELPLDVGQLLKHLTGRPQQHLQRSPTLTPPRTSGPPPPRSSALTCPRRVSQLCR